jgi:hypothetical protein
VTDSSTVSQQQIIQQALDACVSSGIDANSCLALLNQTLGYIALGSDCEKRLQQLAGQNQLKPIVQQAIRQGVPICDVLGAPGQKVPAQSGGGSGPWTAIMVTALGIGLGALVSSMLTSWWKGRSA